MGDSNSTSGLRPNVFVIGAPRCGTTALFHYIEEHPQACVSPIKEPHYLSDEYGTLRKIHDEAAYRSLFSKCDATHIACCEASVWYLYSDRALNRIQRDFPESKVIILVRSPLEFLPSVHNALVAGGFEDELDFRVAWSLQERRAGGDLVPKGCPVPQFLQYARLARFGERIGAVTDSIGSDRVRVYALHEDLVEDAERTLRDLCSFLGLAWDGRDFLPHLNIRERHRIGWLGRLLANPPGKIGDGKAAVARGTLTTGSRSYRFVGDVLRRAIAMNRVPVASTRLRGSVAGLVVETVRDDVTRVSEYVGKDLTPWLNYEP